MIKLKYELLDGEKFYTPKALEALEVNFKFSIIIPFNSVENECMLKLIKFKDSKTTRVCL